jgi:hypothetical protein
MKARKKPPSSARPTVGWREWVRLPELGVRRIKAKIDTGARSSSIHAFDVERFRRAGREMVRFRVHPMQRSTKRTVVAEAELVDERKVRSSSGKAELRPVIVTEVELLGLRFPIEVTLAKRDAMGFRMLLGRQAVRRRFLVDPGRSYLGGRPKRKKKKTGGAPDKRKKRKDTP